MSDQDSGAIGRLNEVDLALGDFNRFCVLSFSRAAVERIVREHTDRALAEVEQRLAKAWDEGYEKALWAIDRGMTPYEGMANPYRAARQERGR